MSSIKVLAFAGARDLIGTDELYVELGDVQTAGELMSVMCERFPVLRPYRASIRIAINDCYAHDADRLADGDEVALIPPVAGG